MRPKPSAPSLGARLLNGALWSVAIRWVSKVLGFVSLAICARVLTPSDYGLINLAMVVVGFFAVFANFGIDAALLRNQECTKEDYDTAWTIKVLQGLVLGGVMALAAPLAEGLYGDTRISAIVLSIAACTAIGGFSNIYVIDFQKQLNFRADFVLNVVPRVAAVALAIGMALVLRNYWALVISICSTYVTQTALSYVVATKRPAWSLQRFRHFFGFSAWYFMQGLADFAMSQADRLMLGERAGARDMGLYSVARETAALPNTEITLPLGRALLPTLSKINDDQQRFAAAVRKTIGGVVAVIAPVSVLLALVAPEFVRVLLGRQWAESAPLVAVFALSGVFGAVRLVTTNALNSLGLVRFSAVYVWVQALLFIALLWPAYTWSGLIGVAYMSLALSMLMSFIHFGVLLKIRIFDSVLHLAYLLRATASIGAMVAILGLLDLSGVETPLVVLTAKCAIGLLAYFICAAVLLRVFGGAEAHERQLLQLMLPAGLQSWAHRYTAERTRPK